MTSEDDDIEQEEPIIVSKEKDLIDEEKQLLTNPHISNAEVANELI